MNISKKAFIMFCSASVVFLNPDIYAKGLHVSSEQSGTVAVESEGEMVFVNYLNGIRDAGITILRETDAYRFFLDKLREG